MQWSPCYLNLCPARPANKTIDNEDIAGWRSRKVQLILNYQNGSLSKCNLYFLAHWNGTQIETIAFREIRFFVASLPCFKKNPEIEKLSQRIIKQNPWRMCLKGRYNSQEFKDPLWKIQALHFQSRFFRRLPSSFSCVPSSKSSSSTG